MPRGPEFIQQLLAFAERGGFVLWAIFLLSVLMWSLIVERYWYLRAVQPRRLRAFSRRWEARSDRSSWYARRIREGMIAEAGTSLDRFLLPIEALTMILPMLGLLGTVDGMIDMFDVISVFGTGNARGIADGVAHAMLTTMAGLVTALSGLCFIVDLKRRTQLETGKVADALVFQ